MSFTRSGGVAPAFSFPIGVGTFTDVNASNAVFTSNVYSSFYSGDGGLLTNVTASIPSTFANLVVSNSVTTTNVFATIYRGDGGLLSNITGSITGNTLSNLNASNLAFGIVPSARIYGNTLSNVQFSNVSGFQSNTSSNLNASNLAFGVVSSALIYGNLISNINSSNLTQPFTNLVVSNTITTTNISAAGFTSNASNTVFNYTTLSVPYINCTSVNVTGTATYSTLNAVNSLATGSIGFATIAGTGGTVTQITSRNTGVTLDKPCGTITLFSSVILSQASNTFTLTNSYIASTDFVLVNHVATQTPGAYTIATNPNAGSVDITMRNVSGGTLTAGAPLLQFVVIKTTNA